VHLKLQKNSLNADFRQHGFEIENSTPESISETFGALPMPTQWTKRIHAAGLFSIVSTVHEVEQIPITKKAGQSLDIAQNWVPPAPATCPTGATCGMEDSRVLLSIVACIPNPDGWRHQIRQLLAHDWTAAFGNVLSVPLDVFLDGVLASAERPFDLRSNVRFLVFERSDGLGQRPNDVTFEDYVRLMVRYGPIERFPQNMLKLFDPSRLANLSQCSFSQSWGPAFQPWFHPELGANSAAVALRNSPGQGWFVRCSSSVPNAFMVEVKRGESCVRCRIDYDALATGDRIFSTIWGGKERRFAGSLDEVLFGILRLDPGYIPVWSTFDGAGVLTSIVDGKELVQALERDWSDGLVPLSFFTPMNSQDD
jgi:hypothetical protein